MANCVHCQKPAGLFRTSHPECVQKHQEAQDAANRGRNEVAIAISRAFAESLDHDDLWETAKRIAQSSSLSMLELPRLFVAGWEREVEKYLDDGVLDENEEQALVKFKNHFDLDATQLDRNGWLTKTAKAAVLRDMLNGVLPQRMKIEGSLPINFQKGEQIIWVFQNTDYLEDKTRRAFVGGSSGVSVRVVKGVYYRVGAFKGQPIEHVERVHSDTGIFVLTNKNLYFHGPVKSFRIPYNKVVSFQPFSDGIGVMRDSASAKAQMFITGDGWFTYNVVTNASQL